jgi:hypothetical protein
LPCGIRTLGKEATMIKYVLIAFLTLSNGQEVGPTPMAVFDNPQRCQKAEQVLARNERDYDTTCVERRAS